VGIFSRQGPEGIVFGAPESGMIRLFRHDQVVEIMTGLVLHKAAPGFGCSGKVVRDRQPQFLGGVFGFPGGDFPADQHLRDLINDVFLFHKRLFESKIL